MASTTSEARWSLSARGLAATHEFHGFGLIGLPLDGHRERDDGIDLRGAVRFVEAPPSARVLGDGAVDVRSNSSRR